jgi:hypothetical protein
MAFSFIRQMVAMSIDRAISTNMFIWLVCVFLIVSVKAHAKGQVKTKDPRLKEVSGGH